ncbi:hypothetical protein Chro_4811 [Chroococcidiopsis thermalis PCC 7203]|uniref:Uncharacterized protein n=1 Tax=Chroococcidiopsis thermalis (strain PCC 7203) TaxID=251229 RepID=K9U6Y9_CHRTP|nr:hypothetical protein Chro_4811 [Chroococcidiopsis thermalis PCC 7203]
MSFPPIPLYNRTRTTYQATFFTVYLTFSCVSSPFFALKASFLVFNVTITSSKNTEDGNDNFLF